MTTPPESYVFVSYSHQDRPIVARLVEALRAHGVTVRWDENLRAGDDWTARLAALLAEAAAVVVVWSKASATSSNVISEATKAQMNATLVPATIARYGVIPEPFVSLQTIDLSDWDGDEHDPNIERLVEALLARISPNQPSASLPVRPAAREILRLALAIADAGGVRDVGPLDVLLACLLQDEYTELDRTELANGATATVVRAIPQPAAKRIAAALRAGGVNRSKIDVPARSIDNPRLIRIVTSADQLARQVGATELWSHHVLAAALAQPLSASVLDALGLDDSQLRTALRAGIAQRWPDESREAWDSVLGPVPRPGVSLVYLNRVFKVGPQDYQEITAGLAILLDRSTAITLSQVAYSLPVRLEALETRKLSEAVGLRAGQITILEPSEPFELRSGSFQLETTIPEPNTPVETIGLDAAGSPFLLHGAIDRMFGDDLVAYTYEALAPNLVLAGAPVLADERVVGLVKAYSGNQILVVPSASFFRAIGDSEDSAAEQATPIETSDETSESSQFLTTSAQTLIVAAIYVHGDRPGPVDAVDVLLGGLGDTSKLALAVELTALWLTLPDTPPRSDRVQAAIDSIGSQATFPSAPSTRVQSVDAETDLLQVPALTSLTAPTRDLVLALGGSGPIDVRHLLGVALGGTTTLPEAVETALGVTTETLRRALREAVRQTAPGEPETVWDELLLTAEPTLVGSFDSDLVVWDDDRQLTDHLDIENYVTMLSLVVASTDTPMPLSIGLFGPWGSGKTYFMGLMRQAIKRLADQAEQDRAAGRTPVSCARIVPITFNAWHYADANLWASLAVRIFDELAGREKKKRTKLEEQRQALVEKLRIYQELKDELDGDRARADEERRQLRDRLAEAQDRKQQAEQKLNGLKVSDVRTAVKDDPQLQQLWTRTSDELKELGISADLAGLTETAAELNAAVRDAVTLRTALKSRRAWTLSAAILAVIGVVLLVAPGVLPALGGTSIVAALAAAGRITTYLQQRAADLRRVRNLVEATISAAEARHRADIEFAEHELARVTAEIVDLEERQAAVTAAVLEAKRQLEDLKAGARLQRFIAERSASLDYQRQLGVVSLARRDFEDLTAALRDAIDDYRAGKGEPPVVDRIVLYIDDLDRCSAERVVEVLEAVHLLLAMDLFVVVVGVDPRWLLRSLRQRFRGVLNSSTEQDRDGGFWQWTPQNYLEKIFQIPFVLPAMSPTGYQELLRSLSPPSRLGREPQTVSLPDRAMRDEAAPQPESTPAADPTALPVEEGSPAAALSAGSRPTAAPAAVPLSPQLLDLTAPELALLGQLAPLVRTPRVAKRMLNIYRMLRVTRDLGPASRFLAGDYQAVCQLLALLTGYPRLFGRIVWGEPTTDGLLDRPATDEWSGFVKNLAPRPGKKGNWANAVAQAIPPAELDDWQAVVSALGSVRTSLTLADTLEPYQRWAPRIARFSFELSPFAGATARTDG